MNYINYKETWVYIVLSFPFLNLGFTSGFSTQYIFELNTNNREKIPVEEEAWIGMCLSFLPKNRISSSGLMLAFLGCLLNGYIMDKYGRKSLLYGTYAIHAIGWMIVAKTDYVIAGRVLVSFGNGVSMGILMYAAEIARPQHRAALSISASAAEIFGSFCIYMLGYYISSLTIAFILSILALILFALSSTIPESPYWLMLRREKDSAIKSLVWMRDGDELGLDLEIEEIEKSLEESSHVLTFSQIILNIKWWKVFGLYSIYVLLIELTGFDMIIPYSVQFFATVNRTEIGNRLVTSIFVIAAFAGTIASMFFVDRVRRKPLLQNLNLFNFVLQVIAATSETFFHSSSSSFVTLICFFIYGQTVATTAFTLPWTTMSELFPTESRATLFSALSTEFNIIYFFIVKFFPAILKTIPVSLIIWSFALFSLLNYVFVFLFVKETKGIVLPGSRNA